jgi:predicted MPP superfamily phosphohydrolase
VLRRLLSILPFLTLFFSLLGGIHFYLWARLARDTGLPAALQLASGVLLALLCTSIPATLIGSRFLPQRINEAFFRPALSWMGIMFISAVAVLASDSLKGAVLFLMRSFAPAFATSLDLVRLNQDFALGALALATSGVLLAFRQGQRYQVKHVEVQLRNLPQALDGFKLVQLSDVHVGATIGRRFLNEVVRSVNALTPDAVVITGDLVDGPVTRLAVEVEPLRDFKSKHGTFFVTGNHEYYSGAEEWCTLLRELGIRVLRNERVSLGNQEAALDLLGIDDYSAAQFGRGHGANLQKAAAGRDPSRVSVLLAHQPRAAAEAAQHGISLQLSGHTHGGQIWPFSLLVKLQQPFVSGLHELNGMRVYVSNGTGYWGPPMRLFAPAEVTEIVLRRAS